MRLRFSQLSEGTAPSALSMTIDAITWPEHLNAFVAFLNAAGFSIDRDNIVDWIDEAADTLPRKTVGR